MKTIYEVAKLAGIDIGIINRANEVLALIEGNHQININTDSLKSNTKQLNIMDYKKDYFLDRVININVDDMTPREALNTLYSLIEDARRLKE